MNISGIKLNQVSPKFAKASNTVTNVIKENPIKTAAATGLAGMASYGYFVSHKISQDSVIKDNGLAIRKSTYTNPSTGETFKVNKVVNITKGTYASTIIDKEGNMKTEAYYCKPSNNEYIDCKKRFTSLDGTETKYNLYESDFSNNYKSSQKISASNGKVLKIDREFERINPEIAYSSINGHAYKITQKEGVITVQDKFSGKKTKVKIENLGNIINQNPELLKTLPADVILAMNNSEGKAEKVLKNADFVKSFEAEKEAFQRTFPNYDFNKIERMKIRLLKYDGYIGTMDDRLNKTEEEMNNAYMFQKFFPNTIMTASELLNPNNKMQIVRAGMGGFFEDRIQSQIDITKIKLHD